jgi:hypothetical protein
VSFTIFDRMGEYFYNLKLGYLRGVYELFFFLGGERNVRAFLVVSLNFTSQNNKNSLFSILDINLFKASPTASSF